MTSKYDFFSISGVNALPRFGQQAKPNNIIIDNILPSSSELSLYIHIPFCKTICQFCMLRKGSKSVNEVPDNFIDSLLLEAELYKKSLNKVPINSLYFGGGTPSMLSAKQFEQIINTLDKIFSFNDDIEITFEGEASSLNNND